MRIRRVNYPVTTFREFVAEHDLELTLRFEACTKAYSAYFDGTDVTERGFLSTCWGNGPSEQDAIQDYARRISGKRLVFGAYTSNRREIQVPNLKLEG